MGLDIRRIFNGIVQKRKITLPMKKYYKIRSNRTFNITGLQINSLEIPEGTIKGTFQIKDTISEQGLNDPIINTKANLINNKK